MLARLRESGWSSLLGWVVSLVSLVKEYDDCVACDLRPSRFGRISEVYRFESVKVYALLRLSGSSAATHLPQ